MALAGSCSISLSHYDSIGNTCLRLGFTSEERFQKKRRVDFQVVVKFSSNVRKSRHTQISSSNRNFSGSGSKWSSLMTSRTEKAFSKCDTRANETEAKQVINVVLEEVLTFIKDWSQLYFMKVAGLLVCTLMVIPSANAVDALKVCSCLLKECSFQ